MRFVRCLILAASISLLSIGCSGGGTSLSGNVTFVGNPVSSGAISLVPLDGGPTVGAEIQNGSYAIENLKPGRYRADIIGFEQAAVVTSSAELQRMAEANQTPAQVCEIPASAQGNGVEVQVEAGSQTHDFELTL